MIIFRYFSREVFQTMAAVAGIVLVISMGWRFSGYLDRAAEGMLSSDILFTLMAYRLPGFLELIIPISFFLALMLVYGRLHVDNEMIVLEACGMSQARLAGITLGMASVVMLITAGIALWIKPLGEREVELLLGSQQNLTEFDILVPGRFQSLSTGSRVTYTRELAKGKLSGVFINEYLGGYNPEAPRRAVTVVAEAGETRLDESGRRFLVLKNGSRYQGRPGERRYQVIDYKEYGQLVGHAEREPTDTRRSAIPTRLLMGATDRDAVSELNWRISVVLMIPVIALLAIPLSRVNPRQGRYTRLVPAMILCFVYVLLLSGSRSALARGSMPLDWGLWWIHLLFAGITVLAFQFNMLTGWISRLLPDRPRT